MTIMTSYLLIMILSSNGNQVIYQHYYEMPSWEKCYATLRESKSGDMSISNPENKVVMACVGDH